MRFNKIGYNVIHSEQFRINRPNGLGDYLLLFVRTRAVFTFNGKDTETPPGIMVLFRKGTSQNYQAAEDVYADDYIHFDLEESEVSRLESLGIPFDFPVNCNNIAPFSEIVKHMYQEMYSVNPRKEETLELYFRLLTVKLSERLNNVALYITYPYYEKLSALRVKIYRDPSLDWSVGTMAKELMLSESYFQHLYKRIFGVSVMADVIRSRVEQAEYLLASTDYSVGQISEMCGYKNDEHFIRQFKNMAGTSPLGYRKRFRISSEHSN